MNAGPYTLEQLGFSAHFVSQLDLDEWEHCRAMRVSDVQRDRITALGEAGTAVLSLSADSWAGDFAVGDWVLVGEDGRLRRRLEAKSSLRRRAAGTDASVQLIANNVDTLFIVSSCNDDFSVARLERYLALASEAQVTPVVLLSKADLSDEAHALKEQAEALMPFLQVQLLNATDPASLALLQPWCEPGQTVALVGSSGVGKTTLLNQLTGLSDDTQGVREDDSKGRHTTTARAMRPVLGGGWVIDTPGMRALRLMDSSDGIDSVFDEITRRAQSCRFGDCQHENEPGCAVQAAIAADELDPERLQRWRKLQREDRHNSQSIAEARQRDKQFGKMVNNAMADKRKKNGR